MPAVKRLLTRLLFWLCWACAAGGLAGAGSAWAEELVAVPPFSGPLVDQAGLLQPEQADELDRRLRQFAQTHGSQIAVLIVPTTRPESIEQYSHRVFDDWKVGRKKINDGVLIVAATQDRKLRIDTGYGLEGAIPDAVAKRIIAETMAPKFREGAAFEGLRDAIGQIEKLIEGEQLPAAQGGVSSDRSGQGEGDWGEMLIPALFAVFVVGGILRLVFGRFFGSMVAGGLVGVMVWFLVSSLIVAAIAAFIAFLVVLAGGGGGSSWGGGDFGSGSSWGGGDGWSGGGGDSGGGGASGDW